ncbi:MAG: arylformamidase [Candidatus Hydrogenedentes bacterium]|nr:arylformamidase [Candidatus Hydrogenedentota bacterium]
MGIRWIDVSIPMRPGMTVWPGDPPFECLPLKRIETGDGYNTSLLHLATHTGTHVDAPWHFERRGSRLDNVDPALFFGKALLIDLPRVHVITENDLPDRHLPPRVLFKTRNSDRSAEAPFNRDFVAIELDAAERLVQDGVRVVGVDGLSVAPFEQEDSATHHCLLSSNVLIVEGLRLKGLAAGPCQFVVLPLPVAGADGAPCRAFIGYEEKTT